MNSARGVGQKKKKKKKKPKTPDVDMLDVIQMVPQYNNLKLFDKSELFN